MGAGVHSAPEASGQYVFPFHPPPSAPPRPRRPSRVPPYAGALGVRSQGCLPPSARCRRPAARRLDPAVPQAFALDRRSRRQLFEFARWCALSETGRLDWAAMLRRAARRRSCRGMLRPTPFSRARFADAFLHHRGPGAARQLVAETRWDWSRRYPVIRLSFAEGVLVNRQQLDRRIEDLLRINREALGVSLYPDLDIPGRFGVLIRRAHAATGEPIYRTPSRLAPRRPRSST